MERGAKDLIAGVDEVGLGPLAGPVVAAAVILDPGDLIEGLADSKKLEPRARERLAVEIFARAKAFAVGRASALEVDIFNVLVASHLAMRRAVQGLKTLPTQILVDGNKAPVLSVPVRAIVKGDQTIPEISAASIIAKVVRDREMEVLADRYPSYQFSRHKGYPTPAHRKLLRQLGPTPIHRRSFGPVRKVMEQTSFVGDGG